MLIDALQNDLKNATLARDEVKVSTLRLLLSEVRNAEIQKGPDAQASDEDIISVIQREVKKRREAASAFRAVGREDSALKEESELKILEGYLPQQLSIEELTKIVLETISEIEASSNAEIGRVIGAVMSKVKGRADGSLVSHVVKEKLGAQG